MDPYKILDVLVKQYSNILKENLSGIYLHGSLAMGCYTEQSDIDFLVVVNHPLDAAAKRALVDEILALRESPKKGIEMSVILKKYAQCFQYPTPFELHYSEAFREAYAKDRTYVCDKGTDYDLAAHMFIIRHRGQCLTGEAIADMFTDLPEQYYIDSILRDIQNTREDIIDNPVYCILNLCRVLYYLRSRVISSKLEGGLWGIKHFPQKYAELLKTAVLFYQNKAHDSQWNTELMIDFASTMLEEIHSLAGPRYALQKTVTISFRSS